MTKPPRNFYTLGSAHIALNANFAGHGIQGGAFIVEILLNLSHRRSLRCSAASAAAYPFLIGDTAGNEFIYMFSVANLSYYSVTLTHVAASSSIPIYERIMDFDVLHVVIDTSPLNRIHVDGRLLCYPNPARLPDFTGLNMRVYLSDFLVTRPHDICGLRLWNYPSGTLPVGWENELRKCAVNPWDRSVIFTDAALKLEYLLDSLVPDASLVIPNRANPGVGDLTITPAGAWSTVRKAWRTP